MRVRVRVHEHESLSLSFVVSFQRLLLCSSAYFARSFIGICATEEAGRTDKRSRTLYCDFVQPFFLLLSVASISLAQIGQRWSYAEWESFICNERNAQSFSWPVILVWFVVPRVCVRFSSETFIRFSSVQFFFLVSDTICCFSGITETKTHKANSGQFNLKRRKKKYKQQQWR